MREAFFWEITSGSISVFSASLDTCFFQSTEAFVLGSCDRFSSALFFFRVQRTPWSSVVHVMRQSTERKNFMFFYVKRWITDPEVDSRLSEHVLRSLVSGSHLSGVRLA